MPRQFIGLRIMLDRGDGKPFIEAEWHDEFGQSQTREIANFTNAGQIAAIRGILTALKRMVDSETV